MGQTPSELIREALRLLLKVQRAECGNAASESPAYSRFETALELMDMGLSLRADRIRAGEDLSEEELQKRLHKLDEEQDVGPGLRISPERLAKLKSDG